MTATLETSAAAARFIAPHEQSILERVYQFILSQGLRGATSYEIEQALGLAGSTVRPRLYTLKGMDKKNPKPARIFTLGETRLTDSGCDALAWLALGVKP